MRGAKVSPFEAAGQVFVVARAESLSPEAANSLLKTLEEPPSRTPRHFLLLAPSELDLLPTLRSRSLAIFLGSAGRPGGQEVEQLADELTAVIDAYLASGNNGELLAAARLLTRAGSFKNPSAVEPWERAAQVVLQAALARPSGENRRCLLAVAQDLLDAPPLRARGVSAERLIEGSLHRRLASLRSIA